MPVGWSVQTECFKEGGREKGATERERGGRERETARKRDRHRERKRERERLFIHAGCHNSGLAAVNV